jgi:hypothetical protein
MRLGPVLSLGIGALVASCSQKVEETPSPPTNASYAINFPSTSTAVATDTVEVLAFDATDAIATASDCLTLITKQKSQADLPKAPVLLARTQVTPVCSLLDGTGGADAGASLGALAGLTYGKRTLLAVGRRQGQDFVIGCATAEITSAESTIEIQVQPANETVVVPQTACTSVSDKCNGGCN